MSNDSSHIVNKKIIIKADDLWLGASDAENLKWIKLFELAKKHEVKISSGATSGVRSYKLTDLKDWAKWLNSYVDDPLFEFWNHGHVHTMEEFSSCSLESQVYSIMKNSEACREIFKKPLTLFGAPHNSYGDMTTKALEICGLNSIYYCEGSDRIFSVSKEFHRSIEHKDFGFNPSFDLFISQNKFFKYFSLPTWVIQVHPPRWTDVAYVELEKIFVYLKSLECEFLTVEDFISQRK